MGIQRAAITAALCAVLTGCTGVSSPTPTPPSDAPLSTPAATTGSAPGTPATTSATTTSTPAAIPTAPLPDYSGAKAMPASDGEPMLWPLSAPAYLSGSDGEFRDRYGFLDVTGRLVLPQVYSSWAYCPDASGRAAYLIAEKAGARAEIRDLTGRLIRRAATEDAQCAGSGHVVYTDWIERELNQRNDQLVDLTTGAVVLPKVRNRRITAIDDHTVNVSDSTGEFFLNLDTGRRTPHPGWVLDSYAHLEAGAPGVPASNKRDGRGKIGFLDRSGSWLVAPRYSDASGFAGGFATVTLGESRSTFLDTSLAQVGGEWEQVDEITRDHATGWRTLGYLLYGAAGQRLVDADLREVVPLGAATITCGWQAEGACAVTAPDGSVMLVPLPGTLPRITATSLPSGFDQALSPTFAADGGSNTADDEGRDTAISRILVVGSGTRVDLPAPTSCAAAGTAFVVCDPATVTQAPIVLDGQGRRTAFASAQALNDPVARAESRYYQVSAGAYRGIVDASGAWHYRQSIYTRLED